MNPNHIPRSAEIQVGARTPPVPHVSQAQTAFQQIMGGGQIVATPVVVHSAEVAPPEPQPLPAEPPLPAPTAAEPSLPPNGSLISMPS